MDAIKEDVQDSLIPPPLPTRFRQAPPPPPPSNNMPPTRSPAPPPPRSNNNATIPVKKEGNLSIKNIKLEVFIYIKCKIYLYKKKIMNYMFNN